MHSSNPQQVRRRDFDTELYDGTCRPSFPFVKWIGELIESMGANHIMDIHRYPDHIPSESLLLSKITHEAKEKESSEAFKRAHSRWQARTIQYNTDTVILDAMGGQWDQQRIVDEIDRIGIKPVEPTYKAPLSDFSKYGRKEFDKAEEMALKQQKTAAQVLVAIKKRCEPGVLDHTTLILNAPGASARTKLISFVQFIEGRRLCDLSVVTVVQDDIRSLDPINTFADAVDNMIAINLLQEELLMMGQPYSDADLIIQHSNKMPNSENFRALKMEFIDCDVSQFSTARPSLTHNQPNPQHLRIRKTWDEYCHRIQRFNASDPMNQPKSALSAKIHTLGPQSEIKALAAAEEPLEAMMRRIISEYGIKSTETPRPTPNQSTAFKRPSSQAERDAFKKGRQVTRSERPPYNDRFPPQAREQSRYGKPSQAPATTFRQRQAPPYPQTHGGQQTRPHQKYGAPPDSRQRPQERRAFSAAEHRDEDEEEPSSDSRDHHAFSASRLDGEDREEEDGEDRYAMMGRRDYDFNGPYESDEGDT